jgi:hypothetical protein
VNGQLVTSSPAEELLARLEEPPVVAALNNLLDHAALPPIDFGGLANSLATLSGTAVDATPALATFLGSLGDPRLIAVITQLTTALVEGRENADGPASVFGLLRVLKDEEVARGAGFLIQVAKSLGRQLAA